MGEIGRNTGGVDNIVQGKLIDEGAGLQEEGERLRDDKTVRSNGFFFLNMWTVCTHLANATRSTSNNWEGSCQSC